MSLTIDLAADLTLETLTVTYGGGAQDVLGPLDIIAVGEDLRDIYTTGDGQQDRPTGVKIRAYLKVVLGCKALPEGREYAPHMVAQHLMRLAVDRKKKFATTLWGPGDGWPESAGSTAG